MSSEKFSLKWNDFEKNISGAFRELKDDADFFDVTLACDSEEQVSAHKVILSACSPFFRQVLRRHKHQHPLLYLHGFSVSDLQSILSFMYLGEVNIATDQLNSFLAIAEELQVKGLTQSGDGDSSQSNLLRRPRSSKNSKPGQSQSQSRPTEEEVEDEDIQEVLPVKTEAAALEEGGDLVSYDEENTEDMLGYNDQHYVAMENSKGELRLCHTVTVLLWIVSLISSTGN